MQQFACWVSHKSCPVSDFNLKTQTKARHHNLTFVLRLFGKLSNIMYGIQDYNTYIYIYICIQSVVSLGNVSLKSDRQGTHRAGLKLEEKCHFLANYIWQASPKCDILEGWQKHVCLNGIFSDLSSLMSCACHFSNLAHTTYCFFIFYEVIFYEVISARNLYFLKR